MHETSELNKSLGQLEEELSKIKSASELITDAKETAERTIIETEIILSDLITQSKTATKNTINESKKLNSAASELLKAVNVLMKRLEKVDFPIRLDKIDTTVSTIISGVQNIVSKLDLTGKNINDNICEGISDVINAVKSMEENFVKLAKKNQIINLTLFFVILLILSSGFITLFIKF